MTTAYDLQLLEEVSDLPAKERLTALIRLMTEDEGIEGLSEALGYGNPGTMRVWLRMNRTPLNHLPRMASHLGVDLGVLSALWLAQQAKPDDAEALFEATKPLVTDPEMKIVHAAREAIIDNDEDLAEAALVRDLRSGVIGAGSSTDDA